MIRKSVPTLAGQDLFINIVLALTSFENEVFLWVGRYIFNLENGPVAVPRRCWYHGLIADFLFYQSAGHGSVDRNVVSTVKNFIVTDNPKTFAVTVLILNLYLGTEENPALLLLTVINNLQV